MNTIEEMTFEELVEWAQNLILQKLLVGEFRGAVFTVCDATARWRDAQNKRKKK